MQWFVRDCYSKTLAAEAGRKITSSSSRTGLVRFGSLGVSYTADPVSVINSNSEMTCHNGVKEEEILSCSQIIARAYGINSVVYWNSIEQPILRAAVSTKCQIYTMGHGSGNGSDASGDHR